MSLKDSLWFLRSMLLCQFAPQFLFIGSHVLVLDPLIHAAFTLPLPPTFVIITMLKLDCPFKVNRTPPLLLHGTLQKSNKNNNFKSTILIRLLVMVCKNVNRTSDKGPERCLHRHGERCEGRQAMTCRNGDEGDCTTLRCCWKDKSWWPLW